MRAALCVPIPPAMGRHLALKVDLLAQVDELLCPLHGLHTGVAFLHQLGRPWVGHLQPQNPGSQSLASDSHLGTRSSGALRRPLGARQALPCQTHLLECIEGLGGHVFVFRALCCPLQDVLEGGVGSMRQAMTSSHDPAHPWVPRRGCGGSQQHLLRPALAAARCPLGTSTSILRRVIL